jgi:hypothetical protein
LKFSHKRNVADNFKQSEYVTGKQTARYLEAETLRTRDLVGVLTAQQKEYERLDNACLALEKEVLNLMRKSMYPLILFVY